MLLSLRNASRQLVASRYVQNNKNKKQPKKQMTD